MAAGAGGRYRGAHGRQPHGACRRSVHALLTLDHLSPLERAAFLLHDVFDSFNEVAAALSERRADSLPPALARMCEVRHAA